MLVSPACPDRCSGAVPCRTGFLQRTRDQNRGSGECGLAVTFVRRDVPPSAKRPLSDKRRTVEKIWREFFTDPSQWWDNRAEKINPKYPDFNHKTKPDGLWLKSNLNPQWVEAAVAAMEPGTLQVDIFTWNRRLAKHVKVGHPQKTLELFQEMQQEGMKPDKFTFVPVLNACSSLKDLEAGKGIHLQISQSDYKSDVYVGSALVDMYAKCGSVEDAWRVFNIMPTRSVVSWNAMIHGYVEISQGQKAVELFWQMQQEGVKPSHITFLTVLKACASVAALEGARRVHEQIIQTGFASNVFVGSSLIKMYSRCGSIEDAQRVFYSMRTRDAVSWNTMLGGYAIHGLATEAIEHFKWMCQEGVQVDKTTFVSLLSACSHGGLVDEGLHYFAAMTAVYDIHPTLKHYTCVIDLLGRAGRLREAEDLIRIMSCEPDESVWMSLLGACKIHRNVDIGERVAKEILKLVPGNPTGYVLLANLYAAAGKWDSSSFIIKQRLERGFKLQPGCTWMEVNKKVHLFSLKDSQYPLRGEITAELERLSKQMKEAGYVSDPRFLPNDVDDENKEGYLCDHSCIWPALEASPDAPLRILKSLQMCCNCYTAMNLSQR